MDVEGSSMVDGRPGRQSHSGSRLACETGCDAQDPVTILPLSFSLFRLFWHECRFGQHYIFFSPGLPSGGGHGLIPARGDPGIGARAPETAVTTPPALARRSAEREKKSESDDRKAFRHPRTRH